MAETQAGTDLKKRNDAYTGFLAISFLAMVGGTVLLYLEYQNYEAKTPPKAPTIDVPGAQLKSQPGTGGAPLKVVEPPPMMMEEPTMMRRTPAPAVLPKTIEAVEAETAIKRSEPVIQIPDVELPMAGLIPVSAIEPIRPAVVVENPVVIPMLSETPAPVVIPAVTPMKSPAPAPVIPAVDPMITDAPPLPTQRFTPPPM